MKGEKREVVSSFYVEYCAACFWLEDWVLECFTYPSFHGLGLKVTNARFNHSGMGFANVTNFIG